MSYVRNCKFCGEKIVMAEDRHGIWQALDFAGGRHGCAGEGSGWSSGNPDWNRPRPSNRSWRLDRLPEPLTYPTNCWWCGAPVFFHTNGNGDCVLFDELGWPWQIHSCWTDYRNYKTRPRAIHSYENELDDMGFDGKSYRKHGRHIISAPADSLLKRVSVQGFIVENLHHDEEEDAFFSINDLYDVPWVSIDICNKDQEIYHFYVPRPVAEQIKEYQIVRATGRWMKGHKGMSRLIASQIVLREYQGTGRITIRAARLGRVPECYYCRKRISEQDEWGFDPHYRLECKVCANMRGNLTIRTFLDRCRRIARNHPPSQ